MCTNHGELALSVDQGGIRLFCVLTMVNLPCLWIRVETAVVCVLTMVNLPCLWIRAETAVVCSVY